MEMDPFFAVTDSIPHQQRPPPVAQPTQASSSVSAASAVDSSSSSSHSSSLLLKQRSRSADALELLKDGSIFDTIVEDSIVLQPPPPPPSSSLIESPVVTSSTSAAVVSASTAITTIAENQRQHQQLDEAWAVLATLLQNQIIEQKHVSAFQSLIRENYQWKEKVAKLKNLLARSAKVQKDVSLFLDKCP